MTHTVVLWKEYREHRTVWVALACLNVAVLLGVGTTLGLGDSTSSGPRDDVPCLFAAILAWTYGVICGAMLLAGETEAGTQPWLDTLPVGRSQLWKSKCLAGVLFVALQTGLIFGVSVSVNLVPQWTGLFAWYPLLLVCALTGLGWGMFFSAYTKTALGAVGLAILVQTQVVPMTLMVLAFVVTVVLAALGMPAGVYGEGLVLALFLSWGVPFVLSRLAYARDDRRRFVLDAPRRTFDAAAWLEPIRLAWRQSRGLALGVIAGSLLLGLLVPANFVILWPLLSLFLGVVCGATAYMDEQGGAYRFLGDQRYPLGRLWLAKLGMRAGLALLGWALMLVPGTLFATAQELRSVANTSQEVVFSRSIPAATGSPMVFLFIWVSHGFATGHLCALLFRKALVAMVVSTGLAALLSCVWIPSIVLGGVSAWQVLSVPAVLVVGSRWLLWPWATDRLASWLTGRRVAVVALMCVGMTALGLRMRVVEIADAEVPAAYHDYLASLPDENHTANQIGRDALQRVNSLNGQWIQGKPKQKLFPEEKGGVSSYPRQAELACLHGWPDDARELDAWIDKVFEEPVWAELEKLRGMTTGCIDDPRRLKSFHDVGGSGGHSAIFLLMARGLQMQKKGQPEVFVGHLETALALTRNLANKSRFGSAEHLEATVLRATRLWVRDLDNDPKLLRRILVALQKHRPILDVVPDDPIYSAYRAAENGLERVSEWLRVRFSPWQNGSSELESAVVELASQVPWERTRLERQIRFLFWGVPRQRPYRRPTEWPAWAERSALGDWATHMAEPRPGPNRRHLCRYDGETLVVALRLYQAEKGKPAASLDALLPAYLPAILNDPFSSKPFRYRLSKGEEIEWPDDLKEPEGEAGGGFGGAAAPGELGAPGGGPPPGMGMVGGAPQPGMLGAVPPAGMLGGAPPGAAAPPGMGGIGAAPAPVVEKWPTRKVLAGQGIVWSVGEDGEDNGGKRQTRLRGHPQPGEDMIFLVPLPKVAKE